MSKQRLNIGTSANDGTGDTLRVAANKINQNFDELYNATAASVSRILAGEGIAVTNDLGTNTITNSSPNRGSYKTVRLLGGDGINLTTTELEGILNISAGANVTITADPTTKTLTFAINEIRSNDIYGTLTGYLNGNVTGNVTGDLTGSVLAPAARITDLQVGGNSGAAVASRNLLIEQSYALGVEISQLQGQLLNAQNDLETATASYNFWLAQPPSSQRTTELANASAQQATLTTTISGLTSTITTKQAQKVTIDAEIEQLAASIATPYASISYNTVTRLLSIDTKVDVQSITTQNPFVLTNHTATQRDSLTPVPGMIIFNLTAKKAQVWDGDAWQNLN